MATLRRVYAGRGPDGADLVCYWFEKARAQIEAGQAQRAGLVATNSIRGGQNRKVLERILATTTIFNAWSDEPWVNEGAAVRVSLVGFGQKAGASMLNGQSIAAIYADLAGSADISVDLTQAKPLAENRDVSFIGTSKKGRFDVPGVLARTWLQSPNPPGRSNSEVLKPWANGLDVARRPSDTWIVDFGMNRAETEAAYFELPFAHVLREVKPARDQVRNPQERQLWWLHARTLSAMRTALSPLSTYIATPRVAKHCLFAWLEQVIGTSLEDRPRYTSTTCFETFPFPEGMTPNLPPAESSTAQAIAEAARTLNELRENWLNPPEWINRVPEVVPGYPDRLIPQPEHAAELKKRTLTNLYNQRPTWLVNAHRTLDEAIAVAYGWPVDLSDDEALRRLLALNQERAGNSIGAAAANRRT